MHLVPVLLLCPLIAAAAAAQTFQPRSINFTGSPAFAQTDLLAAAGLTPGKPLTPADVQAATQRLADTGLFTDVRYSSDGTSLTFALEQNHNYCAQRSESGCGRSLRNGRVSDCSSGYTYCDSAINPAKALLPAHFENFPWWSDAALTAELTARVPLFHGSLPLSGTLQEQVSHALEGLLAERHIPAQIEILPVSDPATSELKSIDYHLAQPSVAIGPLTFSGQSPEWTPALDAVAKTSAGKEYFEGESAMMLSSAALQVFRAKGYAEAAVSSVTPGTPIEQAAKVLVPFTLTLVPGDQYRLGSFSLAGSTLVDPAAFLKAAPLKPGEIAEEAKLRQSLLLVTGPYAAQGYIDAKVSTAPVFHRDRHLVDYAIQVKPGEPYHIGQLTILQLDDARKAQVLAVWALKPGDPFDPSYAPSFLKKNAARLHPLDGYSASYKQIKHFDTHAVDLELTFRKDAALGGVEVPLCADHKPLPQARV